MPGGGAVDAPRHHDMNLLLLPGLLCDRAVWAPILPQLDAVARCDVAEYSDASSLVAMANRALKDAPATFALAGHSMGARVALEIVRRTPERVNGLALLNTGYRARPAGAAGGGGGRRRPGPLPLGRGKGGG